MGKDVPVVPDEEVFRKGLTVTGVFEVEETPRHRVCRTRKVKREVNLVWETPVNRETQAKKRVCRVLGICLMSPQRQGGRTGVTGDVQTRLVSEVSLQIKLQTRQSLGSHIESRQKSYQSCIGTSLGTKRGKVKI